MYRAILVPLDGSPAAEAALAYAALIPSRRVNLLLVEPDEQGPMLASAPELAQWRGERQAEAETYLNAAGAELRRQGREVMVTFVFGDPATRIVEASEDAELIIMATHGRGAGGRALVGSVADRVARHAPVETLVVRGGHDPAAGPPLGRLLVPLDGSSLAERAIPVAARLAHDLGLPLHLVRVVETKPGVPSDRPSGTRFRTTRALNEGRDEAARYLAARQREVRMQDLSATTEVLAGDPSSVLREVTGASDLVVMATHGYGGVRRWLLGSVAEKLIRTARAPVLLVRIAR